MARTVSLALAFLALTGGEAQATTFEVVLVPRMQLSELPLLEQKGAVGLLVPGAGPETSAALAHAALTHGVARNSLRGGLPEGPPLVAVSTGRLGSVAGPAIYVGLPEGARQPNNRRYPILVVGPGYTGVLTSGSTRIEGLVSIADIAPTARGEPGALGYEPREEAAADLLALDRRIRENGRVRLPAELVACALIVLLALVLPAAAVPAVAAVLLANLAIVIAGLSSFWAVLAVVALAAALGGPLLAFTWTTTLRLGLGLAATVTGYLLALGLDSSVAVSPFGPWQNGRFYGLSNLLETFLLVPALAGAALLTARIGWAAFAGVALLSFVTIAGSRFGADGGGAFVLAAGFAVLGVLLAGARRRALLVAVAGSVALALGLLAVDAVTGRESHVTRALQDGPSQLTHDLGDRVSLSAARATQHWYVTLLIVGLLLLLAILVVRTLARHGASREAGVALSLAAALVVSLLVNDSPNDVLLVGITAYLATDRGMLLARWPGPSRLRWSRPLVRSPS